jgi:hypothetical protein
LALAAARFASRASSSSVSIISTTMRSGINMTSAGLIE